MKCVKCNNEMIKTTLNNPPIYSGDWNKRQGYADFQKQYAAHIAYVCEECGYMEFYFKDIQE